MTLDLGSKYLGKLFLYKNFMFNYVFGVEYRNYQIVRKLGFMKLLKLCKVDVFLVIHVDDDDDDDDEFRWCY